MRGAMFGLVVRLVIVRLYKGEQYYGDGQTNNCEQPKFILKLKYIFNIVHIINLNMDEDLRPPCKISHGARK